MTQNRWQSFDVATKTGGSAAGYVSKNKKKAKKAKTLKSWPQDFYGFHTIKAKTQQYATSIKDIKDGIKTANTAILVPHFISKTMQSHEIHGDAYSLSVQHKLPP